MAKLEVVAKSEARAHSKSVTDTEPETEPDRHRINNSTPAPQRAEALLPGGKTPRLCPPTFDGVGS